MYLYYLCDALHTIWVMSKKTTRWQEKVGQQQGTLSPNFSMSRDIF